MTEIPTCPVCLDRFDPTTTGVLTTVCNHIFHCSCLRGWQDSSCPVCRYCQTAGDIASCCETCGESEDLWICLICGNIGCGRYNGEHAKQHHAETGHTYALELETQRVWDYTGDGYVHRLMTNQQDGKIVEFPNAAASSVRQHRERRQPLMMMERSQLPPAPDAEERLLADAGSEKVDTLALQYTVLLTSQLEEQRHFFEQRIETLERRDAAASKKRKLAAERKLAAAQARCDAAEKDNDTLRSLNDSMLANQNAWRDKLRELQQQKDAAEAAAAVRVADMEQQVTDLMFYLDTQKKVEGSELKDELQQGTVLVAGGSGAAEGGAAAPPVPKRAGKKKGKR